MTTTRENLQQGRFTHIDTVNTRTKEVSRPTYFYQQLRPSLPVKYHACLSSYAKSAKTNDTFSRK